MKQDKPTKVVSLLTGNMIKVINVQIIIQSASEHHLSKPGLLNSMTSGKVSNINFLILESCERYPR